MSGATQCHANMVIAKMYEQHRVTDNLKLHKPKLLPRNNHQTAMCSSSIVQLLLILSQSALRFLEIRGHSFQCI
jgi:hypothetical protein